MYAYLMNIIKFYIIHSINEVQAFLVVYSELIDRKRLISISATAFYECDSIQGYSNFSQLKYLILY